MKAQKEWREMKSTLSDVQEKFDTISAQLNHPHYEKIFFAVQLQDLSKI